MSERRLEGHLGDADPCRIGVLGSGSTRLDPVNAGEPLPEEREPFLGEDDVRRTAGLMAAAMQQTVSPGVLGGAGHPAASSRLQRRA